jgi:hypothetical protein
MMLFIGNHYLDHSTISSSQNFSLIFYRFISSMNERLPGVFPDLQCSSDRLLHGSPLTVLSAA